MAWTINVKHSALEDARWFGRKVGRVLLRLTRKHLVRDPQTETRNLKALRPNPIAQCELRLLGDYRVFFNVDPKQQTVQVVLVGKKRGASLFVRGKEFRGHHEGHSTD